MAAQSYQIVFSGELADNVTLATAKVNLQRLLKSDEQTIDKLFSGKPRVLKKNLDPLQAKKYVAALKKAGVSVQVEPPLPSGGQHLSLVPKPDETEKSDASVQSMQPAFEQDEGEQDPYVVQDAQAYTQRNAFCRQCAARVPLSAPVCDQCGAAQNLGKMRSKVTAGVLAILLGGWGVHRFYLGQWWGVFYIFMPFSFLLAWLEALAFFVTDKQRWSERYGDVQPVSALLLVVICIPVFVAIIGILAAIAVPQYAMYTHRAAIIEALTVVNQHKAEVSEFILRTGFVPNANLDAGLPDKITGPYLAALEIKSGGRLVATFEHPNDDINQKTMIWVPTVADGQVNWDCSGGTLSHSYRPSVCQSGNYIEAAANDNLKTIRAKDQQTQVAVPKGWQTLDLHEGATIQVGNPFAEAYFIALPESKVELPDFDLKRFSNVLLESHAERHQNSKIEFIEQAPVNGLAALHYRVESFVEDVDIVYHFAFVEGEHSFYQLLAWSLASRYKGNADKMDAVIHSFHELD